MVVARGVFMGGIRRRRSHRVQPLPVGRRRRRRPYLRTTPYSFRSREGGRGGTEIGVRDCPLRRRNQEILPMLHAKRVSMRKRRVPTRLRWRTVRPDVVTAPHDCDPMPLRDKARDRLQRVAH